VFYHPDTMPPRRAAAAAAAAAVTAQTASEAAPDTVPEPAGTAAPSASTSTSTAVEPGQVKTKFPTARIKRIMQADEEVGKVAQQTPIAVGKALELFMVALVTKSAEVAKQRNSKRVSAQMLKQVVETDDQWDFLREIVGKVETEEKGGKASGSGAAGQSAGSKAKAESESDEEGGEGAPKRRGRGGGRKKKVQ
jgi:histone H3/H4